MSANNKPYLCQTQYMVTVIDANPDSYLVSKMALLPLCDFQRHYTKDGLNHDVFNLYY